MPSGRGAKSQNGLAAVSRHGAFPALTCYKGSCDLDKPRPNRVPSTVLGKPSSRHRFNESRGVCSMHVGARLSFPDMPEYYSKVPFAALLQNQHNRLNGKSMYTDSTFITTSVPPLKLTISTTLQWYQQHSVTIHH